MVRSCDKCQTFSKVLHISPERLTIMSSSQLFIIWVVDHIGLLSTRRKQAKYAIIVVNYFMEWTEVKPLASITERKATEFFWKNLICRYDIPNAIVSDMKKYLIMRSCIFIRNFGQPTDLPPQLIRNPIGRSGLSIRSLRDPEEEARREEESIGR